MALILFGAASNTQSGWQYIISSLLIALLFLGVILPEGRLKGIGISKFLASRLYAGKNATVDIVLVNQSNKDKNFFDLIDYALFVEHDYFSDIEKPNLITLIIKKLHSIFSNKEYTENYFIKTIPANDVIEFSYEFIPKKRGIYFTGSLQLSNSSPLGLFSFSKSFENNSEIIVYPKILDIRGGWVNRISQRSIVSELSYSYMPTSLPGTTRGLREYVPGDSPRHIHWPSSAKANKLLVREFEIESSGYVFVILDSMDDYETEEYFELAVTSAASLLNACHTEGLVTRFATQSDAYGDLPLLKDDDWRSQLELLARVEPISDLDVCSLIDNLNQLFISNNPQYNPTYVLVSSHYKADKSANRSNIVSINVSSRVDTLANYTITSEIDLKYI